MCQLTNEKKNASINKNEHVCEKFVTDLSVSSHV